MEDLRPQGLIIGAESTSLVHSFAAEPQLVSEVEVSAAKADQKEMDTDLPMVVWLKGDEDFFNEFHLDADEAMRILGIKRTRLTQISGRELRVARIRVDRYIKPYYRMEDLQEYLSWTRPTASHQKSSQAIQEAVDVLEKKTHGFLISFQETEQDLKQRLERISEEFHRLLSQQEQTVKGAVNQLQETLVQTQRNFEIFLGESWSNWKHWQTAEMQRLELHLKESARLMLEQTSPLNGGLENVQRGQDLMQEELKSFSSTWHKANEGQVEAAQHLLQNTELQKQFLLSLHGIQQEMLKTLGGSVRQKKNGTLKWRRPSLNQKIGKCRF